MRREQAQDPAACQEDQDRGLNLVVVQVDMDGEAPEADGGNPG
jgi:hypothetical protein